MGLFSKIINALAGSTSAPTSKRSSTASTNNQDQELSGWLSVKAAGKDWFCQTAVSPNGRFTLAWADQDASGGGGYRTSGNGRYFLFDNSKKVLEGELQRPNDGHVADNGTLILADWLFGDGLKSKLFVLKPMGRLWLSSVSRRTYTTPDSPLGACPNTNHPSTIEFPRKSQGSPASASYVAEFAV